MMRPAPRFTDNRSEGISTMAKKAAEKVNTAAIKLVEIRRDRRALRRAIDDLTAENMAQRNVIAQFDATAEGYEKHIEHLDIRRDDLCNTVARQRDDIDRANRRADLATAALNALAAHMLGNGQVPTASSQAIPAEHYGRSPAGDYLAGRSEQHRPDLARAQAQWRVGEIKPVDPNIYAIKL
jgi:chromosome segregation ATPase